MDRQKHNPLDDTIGNQIVDILSGLTYPGTSTRVYQQVVLESPKGEKLKQRFAGVDTLSLKEMLWQNKNTGPYDEYLQVVHDEVQRRQEEPMCLICAETNAQKLHECHLCGEIACIEHSELIDEKYWLCFDCIK